MLPNRKIVSVDNGQFIDVIRVHVVLSNKGPPVRSAKTRFPPQPQKHQTKRVQPLDGPGVM